MKRWLTGLFLLLLVVPAIALADTSTVILGIDDTNLYDGMTRTYSQGYSPTVSNGVATIVLPLVTTGSISGSTITATPNLGSVESSPFVFGNYQKTVALGTQSVNNGTGTAECYYIRFDLALTSARKNGSYPVVISVEGLDLSGNTINQNFTTYVTITDGTTTTANPTTDSGSSSGGVTASKPVLIVTACSASPDTLKSGDTMHVSLTVKNVGRRTAQNVRVNVTSDDANIVLLDEYSAPYLAGLARTKEADFSFDMQALPMALGGMHTMTITIAYESSNNTAYTETAAFRVTVDQPILFSHDKVELPKNITSGESFSLPVNAYNTGLTTIYNVKCTLEVPGLIAASAYLGNLEPQQSSDKTMSVFATTIDSITKYGTSYGACVFTYEDAEGEQYQESVDVKIEILEPVKQTDEEKKKAEEEAKEQKALSQWWISLLFGLAIIAILTAVIIIAKFSRMMKMR
ncbi:MAG TPA: CARDB domain-containing protein [Candidatus Cryosericum sp.]|nr:CARDB domain-containing protein [Candidatus Cryosericum sp.]